MNGSRRLTRTLTDAGPASTHPSHLSFRDKQRGRRGRACLVTALAVLTTALVGCANLNTPLASKGQAVAGMQLNGTIPVDADSAHALFQDGRQTPRVNHFNRYCKLQLNTVSDQPQSVAPDYFEVYRVDYRILIDDVTEIPIIAAGSVGCEDPVYYETRLRLRSDTQPKVRALICLNVALHCGGRNVYRHLDADEMQAILGPAFSWRLRE